MQKQNQISTSPHSIWHYKHLLSGLSKSNLGLGTIEDLIAQKPETKAALRHDIDTPGCLKNLKLLTKEEESVSLQSTVYILCDDSSYKLSAADVGMFSELSDKGFHLGLHTRAHISSEPRKYFTAELNQFKKLFSFAPKSVTLHGEFPRPENYESKREAFVEKFPELEASFGCKLLHPSIYPYSSLTDAVFDEKRNSILTRDFSEPLEFIAKTRVPVVINTHPVYWAES